MMTSEVFVYTSRLMRQLGNGSVMSQKNPLTQCAEVILLFAGCLEGITSEQTCRLSIKFTD